MRWIDPMEVQWQPKQEFTKKAQMRSSYCVCCTSYHTWTGFQVPVSVLRPRTCIIPFTLLRSGCRVVNNMDTHPSSGSLGKERELFFSFYSYKMGIILLHSVEVRNELVKIHKAVRTVLMARVLSRCICWPLILLMTLWGRYYYGYHL